MTSRGWLVDLIHSIGEKLALCDHLAEKLDDGNAKQLYELTLEERRREMQLLVDSVNNPNLEYWCGFKHALKSWVLAMEIYDSSSTQENLNVAKKSGDILAGVTALFLGLDFKVCERCVYEQLLTKERSSDGNRTKG